MSGLPGSGTTATTDGPYVTACWNEAGSTPSELTDHIAYMNGAVAAGTNLVTEMGTCDAPNTDMLFDDNLTTADLLGLTTCLLAGGDFGQSATTTVVECEQWQVQINPSEIASDCAPLSASAVRRAIWCHESGHGLGLGHENSCMAAGCITTNTYSTHHIDVHLSTL